MKNIAVFILVMLSCIASAQDFKSEFKESFQDNDSVKQLKVLLKWEKARPNDAELYTAYYNYYLSRAKDEMINLSTDKPENGEALVLKDSLDKTAGYLSAVEVYDNSIISKAFAKIDKGIALYPDRLDMRFGKIYALGKTKDWKKFTSEIIKTIDYSNSNKNAWTWTDNVKKEDGQNFLLASIQDYQVQLYNTERDDLLPNMREIALSILKYYPEHVESLSNLSITYFLTGQFEKGLEALLKAEKINPKDYVVLSNIAHGYNLSGNKAKSIEYYEKVISYGDDNAKNFAKKQIEELKK